MPQEPVFVVVSGGLVQHAPRFVEVIDFDNLLPDMWSNGDTKRAWDNLSKPAQEYVAAMYPQDHARILARIAEDKTAPVGLHGA